MRQPVVFAALAATLLAVPVAAEAQRLAQRAGPELPPYEIVTIIRSAGYDPIGRPVRRGATYALRAIDEDGTQVRVIVDAHYGEILSVAPLALAPRNAPPGPFARRVAPEADDYIPPDAPRIDRLPGARIDDDEPRPLYPSRRLPGEADEPSPSLARRPPAPVPAAPPPVIRATPEGTDAGVERVPPRSLAAPQPDQGGLLPPPPERFPQRPPPASVRPEPMKRAAALPKQAPLPKPRPGAAGATAGAAPPSPTASPPPGTPSTTESMPH